MTQKLDHLNSATGRPINTITNLWAFRQLWRHQRRAWGAGRSLSPSALCAEAASGAAPVPQVQGLGRPAPTWRRPGYTSDRGSAAGPPGLETAADRSPWCGSELAHALPHSSGTGSHSAAHSHLPRPQRTHSTAAWKNPPLTACRGSWLDGLLNYHDWLARLEWQKQLL